MWFWMEKWRFGWAISDREPWKTYGRINVPLTVLKWAKCFQTSVDHHMIIIIIIVDYTNIEYGIQYVFS